MQSPPKSKPLPTASRKLTTVLVRRILEGTYATGQRLPAERELHQEFHVSRHVVREALKRLEVMGLIRIQHGSGAYTEDVFLNGGIELFEYLLHNGADELDVAVLSDFFDFWEHFLPEVYRRAAESRREEDLAAWRGLLEARASSMHGEDLAGLFEAHLRAFQVLGRAANNTLYQLILNNVVRVLRRMPNRAVLEQSALAIPQHHMERLAEALEEGDGDLAALIGLRQVRLGRESLLRAIAFA